MVLWRIRLVIGLLGAHHFQLLHSFLGLVDSFETLVTLLHLRSFSRIVLGKVIGCLYGKALSRVLLILSRIHLRTWVGGTRELRWRVIFVLINGHSLWLKQDAVVFSKLAFNEVLLNVTSVLLPADHRIELLALSLSVDTQCILASTVLQKVSRPTGAQIHANFVQALWSSNHFSSQRRLVWKSEIWVVAIGTCRRLKSDDKTSVIRVDLQLIGSISWVLAHLVVQELALKFLHWLSVVCKPVERVIWVSVVAENSIISLDHHHPILAIFTSYSTAVAFIVVYIAWQITKLILVWIHSLLGLPIHHNSAPTCSILLSLGSSHSWLVLRDIVHEFLTTHIRHIIVIPCVLLVPALNIGSCGYSLWIPHIVLAFDFCNGWWQDTRWNLRLLLQSL